MSGFLLKIWTGPDNCCSLVGSAGDPASPFEVHQYAAMGVTTKVGGRHVIEHESILCPMTEIHVEIPPAVIKRWAAMVVEAEQRRGEVYCSVDCAGVCHALDDEAAQELDRIANDSSHPRYTGERPYDCPGARYAFDVLSHAAEETGAPTDSLGAPQAIRIIIDPEGVVIDWSTSE